MPRETNGSAWLEATYGTRLRSEQRLPFQRSVRTEEFFGEEMEKEMAQRGGLRGTYT